MFTHAIRRGYGRERLRRNARHYNFSYVGSGNVEINRGIMDVGSTALVVPPLLLLRTAAGANLTAERAEDLNNQVDPWQFSIGGPAYYDRSQYLSCIVMPHLTAAPGNPTATQYIGVSIISPNNLGAWPVPPASAGADPWITVYARTTDGQWFLRVDDGTASVEVALAGVPPFTPDRTTDHHAFLVEITYEPLGPIVAYINGIEGGRVTSTIPTAGGLILPHQGAGVFVTSGSHAAGRNGGTFTDLYVEIICPEFDR